MIPNFDKQTLRVQNKYVIIELLYERHDNQSEFLNQNRYDKIVTLNEIDNWTNALTLKITFPDNAQKTILITGIEGGFYLHTATEKERSYTVKLIDNTIVFCLGHTFFSFDINLLEIKWEIRPDIAGIFEFYDLEDDFLVRGELAIHRIDTNGHVKWSYMGRDIWVTMDGKPEVVIENDKILLTDFDHNEYVINFNGETLKDKPRGSQPIKPTNKWWKFW